MHRNRILTGALLASALVAHGSLSEAAPPISAGAPLLEAASLERSFVFRGLFFSLQANDLAVVSAQSPGVLLSLYKSGSYIRRIDAKDHFVLLANETAGLRVLSYANPKSPKLLRLVPPSAGYATKFVKIVGKRAFVTEALQNGASSNLKIYDVSSPATPVLRQTLALPGAAGAIVPVGPAHIAVSAGSGVAIVYVGYPKAFVRSTVPSPSPAGMVSVGNLLYISRGCGRFGCGYFFFEIWDLSTPKQPRLLKQHRVMGWYPYSENSLSIAQIGGRRVAFLSVTDGGQQEVLGILDVTTPTAPKALKFLRLQDPAGWWLIPADVDVIGTVAFVWGWRPPHFPPGYEYFTTRIDVRDPANPKVGKFTQVPPK